LFVVVSPPGIPHRSSVWRYLLEFLTILESLTSTRVHINKPEDGSHCRGERVVLRRKRCVARVLARRLGSAVSDIAAELLPETRHERRCTIVRFVAIVISRYRHRRKIDTA
jgi:hypothetical protein